jgi:hypothetical protein
LKESEPPLERTLYAAQRVALAARVKAREGNLAGVSAKKLLAAELARARKTMKTKRKVIGATRPPGETSLGGILFDSGDEYLGQIVDKIESGVGSYLIYALSSRASPNQVSRYFGEMDAGRFGRLGVFEFSSGSVFMGEWIDRRPKFGYVRYETDNLEFDHYFGEFSLIEGKTPHLWLPHGYGVGVNTYRRQLFYGKFDAGRHVAYPSNSPVTSF